MKTSQVVSILGLLVWASGNVTAEPLGTAFTYQGQLTESGAAAQGLFDFRFAIYDAASGGSPLAGPLTNSAVGVSNGLFTAKLDFGTGVFTGEARWLEIAVRTNGAGAFTTLSPRQPLTSAPYALYAPSAGAAASATLANSAATVAPNGVANTSLQANAVTSDKIADGSVTSADVAANTFWSVTGNAGTTAGTHFLGTTDNQPLELRVNNAPALRLEPRPTSPSVIGGFGGNWVAAGSDGAVIGGGGSPDFPNAIFAHYGTIGGGWENTIQSGADSTTISGGTGNQVLSGAAYATVGGGIANRIGTNAIGATIAGGDGNQIGPRSSQATIAGGNDNDIEEDAPSAFVGGGEENTIQNHATHAVLAGGERNSIHAGAQHAVIGGGQRNWIGSNALTATIAGGHENHVSPGAQSATIGGGSNNYIETNAFWATIAGGAGHMIELDARMATISGGSGNEIHSGATGASIGGGQENFIRSDARYATIGGGAANTVEDHATHAVLAGGERNRISSEAYHSVVGGGRANTVRGEAAMVGGGTANAAFGMHATVAGGSANTAGGGASTVSGGSYNVANGGTATIGGGEMNRAEGSFATIAGGGHNNASGYSTAVGGGWENAATGLQATVAGGYMNTASGDCATVPGGRHNRAGGASAFAAGHKAEARHDGAFVWGDSTDDYFCSTGTNQFLIRALGGVGINTNAPQSALHVAGTVTAENFRGPGTGLVEVNADRLDGRDSTDFAFATHAHNAGDITSETLPDARLPANVPRLNVAQTFTAANQFTHAGNVFVGTFQGQGGGLTNLDAGNLTSGTLADARLGTNIPRLNAPANFTAPLSAPVVQATNLVADVSSLNNAALTPGLVLGGSSSGEGLASKRTAGGNQYGLDLFTAFTSRLAIANNGAIHIGAGNAFASYGDARSSIYVLRGTSSGASYTELFLPGNQRLSVPLNSTWTFRAFVSGRASSGKAAGYCFRGFLENEGGTVRLLEAVNTEDYAEDDSAWDANLAANDYYDALVITARGNTGDSVRWVAVVYTVEVKW